MNLNIGQEKKSFRNVTIPQETINCASVRFVSKACGIFISDEKYQCIFGVRFVLADYALLDAKKIDYHSFDYYFAIAML